jgi:hypothetical protein
MCHSSLRHLSGNFVYWWWITFGRPTRPIRCFELVMQTGFSPMHIEHIICKSLAIITCFFTSHSSDKSEKGCTKKRCNDTSGTKSVFRLLIDTIAKIRGLSQWIASLYLTYGILSGTSRRREYRPPRTIMPFPNGVKWIAMKQWIKWD